MIEKKPPQFTGPVDLDDEFPNSNVDANTHHSAADTYGDEASEDISNNMNKARERKGLWLTYGTGAAFFAIVVVLAYPQFKKYFVTEAPKVQTFSGVPVPGNLRDHILAGPNAAPETAPAGALPDMPVAGPIENPSPQTNSSTATASGVRDTNPGSVPETATTTGTSAVSSPETAPSGPATPPAAMGMDQTALPSIPSGTQAQPSSALPLPGLAGTSGTTPSAAKADEMGTRLSSLEASVKDMAAQKDIVAGQMQQIQASLDVMQKQLSEMASRNTASAVSGPAHAAPRRARHAGHAGSSTEIETDNAGGPTAPMPADSRGSWELRSATPGSALISRPGSNDLKHIGAGDVVSGLGKITSIEMQDGSWVVRGTKGSVTQ